MRWIVLSLLLAGCADGMTADVRYGDGHAPEGGQANRGGAGGSGGAGVDGGDPEAPARVCDAPLESLNGRAEYVPGTVAAVDPAAEAAGMSTTCENWARQDYVQRAPAQLVTIIGGMTESGMTPVSMIAIASDGGRCIYTLRLTTKATGFEWPCATTIDYALTVP